MRLAVLTSLALASSILTACTSASVDALDIRPSADVVSSIEPAPVSEPMIAPQNEVAQNPYPAPLDYQEPAVELAPIATPIPAPKPAHVATFKPQKPAVKPSRSGRQTIYSQKFRDAKPVKFGKASPNHFAVHGVDVSRWQGKINWSKLRKQGANFAFIKATDGGDHLDKMFKTNWKEAAEAGVPRGAYHFMYWCRSGEAQARWFIRNVPKVKGALPPVIDAEWNHQSKTCRGKPSPKKVRARMRVFMEMVERHYGQRPIIYTAPDFYEDNLRGHFKKYPFWLRSVAQHPHGRYPERKFLFWQYSGTGLSRGHPTRIDLNVFNGSEAAWHKWVRRAAH